MRWSFEWDATPARHRILVRATDTTGATQPDEVAWNDLGYDYDGVVAHPVTVHALAKRKVSAQDGNPVLLGVGSNGGSRG